MVGTCVGDAVGAAVVSAGVAPGLPSGGAVAAGPRLPSGGAVAAAVGAGVPESAKICSIEAGVGSSVTPGLPRGGAVAASVGAGVGISGHSLTVHEVHSVDPRYDTVHLPAAQPGHSLLPYSSENLLTGQSEQLDMAVSPANRPGGHSKHVYPDDVGWNWPIAQFSHSDEPDAANCPPLPPLQLVQTLAPDSLEYLPGEHASHEVPER